MFNPKYPIDKLININKELWRIASYRNKYGHTLTYTLKKNKMSKAAKRHLRRKK